jgi:3-isopropylmalate/(R)-2-methylmalate dehydratase small subunit
MKKFTELQGIATAMPDINIDTDAIIPKQFLKTIHREGLGKNLFYDKRYNDGYNKNTDFVLNQEPWSKSNIIVAGENFGCGSSREHAPWALLDFGIHCIISNSFADIFFNNSIKNGLLLITLDKKKIDMLMKYATNKEEFIVNLIDENIIVKNSSIKFKVDPVIKNRLVNGYDDIEITLKNKKQITDYENDKKKFHIWKKIINDN